MTDLSADIPNDIASAIDTDNAFIGTVHRLVTKRTDATKTDLILAAASHALRSGDKTTAEITVLVNRIWPGARTGEESVSDALFQGRELNLVEPRAALGGGLWGLTVAGVEDVDRQSEWVRQMRDRARDDLKVRALSDLGMVPNQAALELWLERLIRALIEGVQRSQDAYFGKVENEGNRLSPRGIDFRHVYRCLEDDRIDKTVVDFLKACAAAAFDPMTTFGSDLVSTITTGCVLHSYAAGRDNATLLKKLGTPEGQRALIDTPMLVDLIGPRRVRESVQKLIEAAVEAKWEVIVCEHSIEELTSLIEREIPTVREAFTKAHVQGIRREWYASLAEGQIPSYCVEVLQDGTYDNLEGMVTSAYRLAEELVDLGVEVRPHHGEHDEDHVSRLREALTIEIEARSGWRTSNAIDRDAQSMAVVGRRRGRERTTKWPGGWIISPDSYISSAYKRVHVGDQIPLTLSAARWGTLLAATVPPAEVVELAEAAAGQLLDEAMWLLPVRFPSDKALEIARQLEDSNTATDMDVRFAQLSLDDMLDEASQERSATTIAAQILNARVSRDAALQKASVHQASLEKGEAEHQALIARASAESAIDREARTALRASGLELRTEQLELDLAWQKTRGRRQLLTAVTTACGVLSIAAAFFGGSPAWLKILVVFSTVAILVTGLRWSQLQSRRWFPLLIAGTIEVGAAISTAVDLADLAQP